MGHNLSASRDGGTGDSGSWICPACETAPDYLIAMPHEFRSPHIEMKLRRLNAEYYNTDGSDSHVGILPVQCPSCDVVLYVAQP